MISFKRDIYKVRPMPKPTRPVLQRAWFVSESQDSTIDHCLPIVNQVFKVPNTAPAALGEFIYLDIAESNPLVPTNTGSKPNYTISQISTQSPNGTIINITVDAAGEIVKMSNGACNPSLNLVTFNITEAAPNQTAACSLTLEITVKVDASNIAADGSLNGGTQLYNASSQNSNYQNYDPSIVIVDTVYGGYNEGNNPYISAGTQNSNVGTQGLYNMFINQNGMVNNKSYC